MEHKMRRIGAVMTGIGTVGVIIFGLLLMQVMDDPKARTAALKWGFILMALLGGMGVYVLSFALSKPRRRPREEFPAQPS
jgi:lipid-A-disaccharide synthase-like uncharacterized protein